MAKDQRVKDNTQGSGSSATKGSDKIMEAGGAVPGIVEAVVGRTGSRGELTQVKVRVLQGRNAGKQIRRNVRGPIKPKDVLMMRETEIEARKLMKRIQKGAFS
jgi:small subunit ribosomal protein S28e